MHEIQLTDIVLSLAGRDKNQLFYVLSIENGYAFLTDGKLRKISKPKKKKLKHLQFEAEADPLVAEKLSRGDEVSDKEIRKQLAIYKSQRKA
ncbi:hypothetical protein LJC01_02775 [Clostridiaceae bacterium OttesenSCG-928-D20]|nr:hypothetical protein [Clostridiaceae bacterium OttesenSCG-928-D20]